MVVLLSGCVAFAVVAIARLSITARAEFFKIEFIEGLPY
jgi:hypothetical protein